jgi:hypothetical protein
VAIDFGEVELTYTQLSMKYGILLDTDTPLPVNVKDVTPSPACDDCLPAGPSAF